MSLDLYLILVSLSLNSSSKVSSSWKQLNLCIILHFNLQGFNLTSWEQCREFGLLPTNLYIQTIEHNHFTADRGYSLSRLIRPSWQAGPVLEAVLPFSPYFSGPAPQSTIYKILRLKTYLQIYKNS